MNAPLISSAPQRARFTIVEFLRLDKAGVLDRFAKTELIDGEIIVLNMQYSEHFTTKTRLLRRLADACDALDRGLEAWSEGSIAIEPDHVPQPDVFVTSRTPVAGLVALDTVVLVVEVASSTLTYDLGRKAQLYAAAGIPEYWVADVTGRVIHQLWAPIEDAYTAKLEVAFGDTAQAATIAGLAIDTQRL